MDSRGDILNLDVGHLQKIGGRVTRLLRKECRDAIETMYVLKATLHLLRRELTEGSVVLDNEAELDTKLHSIIDEAIRKVE